MDLRTILSILRNNHCQWYRVNDNACINTLVRDYTVNLCKYQRDGVWKMKIDVDNIKKNHQDVINETFLEDSREYQAILPFYEDAINTSKSFEYA